MTDCVFYDGKNSFARPVDVVLENDSILIYKTEGENRNLLVSWNVNKVSRLKVREDEGEFCLTQGGTARLIIRDFNLQQKLTHKKNIKPSISADKKIIIYCVVSVAAIGLFFWQILPLLTRPIISLIPYSLDEKLGAAAYKQLINNNKACDNKAGIAALEKMKIRSMPQKLDKTKITIIDSDTENALAFPGGYIVVFRGLLDKAYQPAMLSAVLTHEAGHIVGRHSLEKLFSQLAAGAIITVVTGDISLLTLLGVKVLTGHYTKNMEEEADVFANELMREKQIDPKPIANWFLSMEKGENSVLDYFKTHPEPTDRAAFFTKEKWKVKEILTPQEWVNLKNICS